MIKAIPNYSEGVSYLKYLNDLRRIQRVVREHGYDIDLPECAKLWNHHSGSEEWAILPNNDGEVWLEIGDRVIELAQ